MKAFNVLDAPTRVHSRQQTRERKACDSTWSEATTWSDSDGEAIHFYPA